MEHTPGPWIYRIDKAECPYVASANKNMIADVNLTFVSGEEAIANAHLIAAAPDLLKSCKAVADYLRKHPNVSEMKGPEYGIWHHLMSAIDKAEGGNHDQKTD